MYTVSRTGRAADMAAEIRAVPAVVVPKAAAKALTFTAQAAQKSIIAAMGSSFQGGATRYTLNSTRIQPATVEDLSARVAVKDRTTNNGTLPEDYLYPQVYGGPRKEKRFERAMRYAGLLQGRERAMLGEYAPVDSYGNLKKGEIQKILTATRSAFDPYQNRSKSVRSKRNAKKAPYFAARIGKTWGVWKRDAPGELVPILVFVTKPPIYRSSLDFEGIARTVAQREFEPTFRRLLAKESA